MDARIVLLEAARSLGQPYGITGLGHITGVLEGGKYLTQWLQASCSNCPVRFLKGGSLGCLLKKC